MALIGNATTPYTGEVVALDSMLYGDLITPFEAEAPDLLGLMTANRFPVPASAIGFMIDPLLEIDIPIVVDGIEAPYTIAGALVPEGNFLEPTIGQIWPR